MDENENIEENNAPGTNFTQSWDQCASLTTTQSHEWAAGSIDDSTVTYYYDGNNINVTDVTSRGYIDNALLSNSTFGIELKEDPVLLSVDNEPVIVKKANNEIEIHANKILIDVETENGIEKVNLGEALTVQMADFINDKITNTVLSSPEDKFERAMKGI